MTATKLNHKAKTVGSAKVRFYGRMGPLGLPEKQREAYHLGKNLGAAALCSILPADQDHPAAWHRVIEFSPGDVTHAEGVVLRQSGQGAIFTSRDCPIVTIADMATGLVGAAHAGRRSLLRANAECSTCDTGVLERLLAIMGHPYGENLVVYVTGGISAKNFQHEREHVEPFWRKFGLEVVPDPHYNTLDLFRVIKKICMRYGVKKDRIISDGICTFETEWAGSRRAKREGSNWTYVIRHR